MFISMEQRQKQLNRLLGITDQPNFHRHAQPNALGVGIDLDTTAIARLWQIFNVRV